jgi:hypothetical protein
MARLSQARIFFALSLASIFSGAVAFIGAEVCADTAVAKKSTLKATAEKKVVRLRMVGVLNRKLVWNDPALDSVCNSPAPRLARREGL